MTTPTPTWYTELQTRLASYPAPLPDIILFAPLGFLAGFLLKSFGRYFIFALLLAIGILWCAQYFNLATIHQREIELFLGLPPFTSPSDFVTWLVAWAQNHIAACISLIIGFLLGWKLGF
jgi:uncharacterized membrane protein (Fun14 family)